MEFQPDPTEVEAAEDDLLYEEDDECDQILCQDPVVFNLEQLKEIEAEVVSAFEKQQTDTHT